MNPYQQQTPKEQMKELENYAPPSDEGTGSFHLTHKIEGHSVLHLTAGSWEEMKQIMADLGIITLQGEAPAVEPTAQIAVEGPPPLHSHPCLLYTSPSPRDS